MRCGRGAEAARRIQRPAGVKKIWCFILGFLCFYEADAQGMSKVKLQKIYVDYLRSEGFSPSIDNDGDIFFKYQGGNYYIYVYEQDIQYFRLVCPNIWKIESPAERINAALAASKVNSSWKLAKVYVADWDDVMVSADILIQSPSDFTDFFYRMLEVLNDAKNDFWNQMRRQQEETPRSRPRRGNSQSI
jgi:hypothetical protein